MSWRSKMNKRVITLSGNIGVGKTTLGKYLSDYYNATWLPESMYSSQIQHLIANDSLNSRALMQMAFSTMRVATLASEILNNNSSNIIIVERNLRDSILFHEVWEQLYDFNIYKNFFRDYYKMLDVKYAYEEVVVWLKCPIDTILSRINLRNQISEVAHTRKLVTLLESAYNNLYKNNTENLKIIGYNTENLILDSSGINEMINYINNKIEWGL